MIFGVVKMLLLSLETVAGGDKAVAVGDDSGCSDWPEVGDMHFQVQDSPDIFGFLFLKF